LRNVVSAHCGHGGSIVVRVSRTFPAATSARQRARARDIPERNVIDGSGAMEQVATHVLARRSALSFVKSPAVTRPSHAVSTALSKAATVSSPPG
jgi:hypothetical protein